MRGDVVFQASLRTLTSVLVAILFLLLLVVASAQQQALIALKAAKVEVSYSVARKVMREAQGAGLELTTAKRELNALSKSTQELQSELDQIKSQYFKQIIVVREIAGSIRRAGRCGRFAADGASPEDDMSLWQGINSCLSEDAVPTQSIPELRALQAPERNPSELRERIERIEGALVSQGKQMASSEKTIKDLSEKLDKAKSAVDAMEDISVLDTAWIVRSLGLTSVPPALMQILLSFAGGLFGALLLTLILAVYPNSDLKFTAGEGYWNRILLGGLISVSVFVVLGGGVAVLGSSDALSNAGSNFLAFCAIGILAGMFSDRVAKWLSDRAQIFVTDGSAQRA